MPTRERAPVLVIEDDPEISAFVADLFDEEGMPLVVAHSGREGLQRLQATAEHMVVLCSGVLRDMSPATLLQAVVRDGGLARRHAFVIAGPEAGSIAEARAWQDQVPLFTLLEPYSFTELQATVGRAGQCVALSSALYDGGRAEPAGAFRFVEQRPDGRDATRTDGTELAVADHAEPEPDAVRGVLIVGGAVNSRGYIAQVLSRGPYPATLAADEEAALAWLRACLEPMVVVLDTTLNNPCHNLMRLATEEIRLVRHTYLVLLPAGQWPSEPQRAVLGLLNAPIVRKPFSPKALRGTVTALATPAAPGLAGRHLV